MVAALFPVYTYTGAAATGFSLVDQATNIAFNLVFIIALALGALLAFPARTGRLGAGMLIGAGTGFAAHLINDVGSVTRSGPQGSPDYAAAGPGFWWEVAGGATALAVVVVAIVSLRRCGALRLRPTRTSILWAISGLVLAAAWLVGTWMPWSKQTVTWTLDGTTKSVSLGQCCDLSDSAGPMVAQALVIAILIAAVALVGSCTSSAAASCGALVGVAICAGADNVVAVMVKPMTIDQLASSWNATEEQLRAAATVVDRVTLPGAWIAAMAVLGVLVLAVARGLHGAAAAASVFSSPTRCAAGVPPLAPPPGVTPAGWPPVPPTSPAPAPPTAESDPQ